MLRQRNLETVSLTACVSVFVFCQPLLAQNPRVRTMLPGDTSISARLVPDDDLVIIERDGPFAGGWASKNEVLADLVGSSTLIVTARLEAQKSSLTKPC